MLDEIGQNFADDTAELETVPAEPGGDLNLGEGGVWADGEVEVGSQGVEAGGGPEKRTVQARQQLADLLSHGFDVVGADGAIHGFRGARFGNGFPVEGDFDAALGTVDGWKSVRRGPIGALPDVDGEAIGRECLGAGGRVEPE